MQSILSNLFWRAVMKMNRQKIHSNFESRKYVNDPNLSQPVKAILQTLTIECFLMYKVLKKGHLRIVHSNL